MPAYVKLVLLLPRRLPDCCSMCLKGSLGTIVAGDFNCPPDSLEMHMLRALLPHLHDCWEQLHPQQPGFTSTAVNNSFTKPGETMLHRLL